MRPASDTKHVKALACPPFVLAQSDDGQSNGTTLWLAGQLLALYLAQHLPPPTSSPPPRAVELGSGVGLTALVLAALGYHVLATDTHHVCAAVLRRNIAANLPHLPPGAGPVEVRELDWTDPVSVSSTSDDGGNTPLDLIISSDTLYDPSLVQPFFRTVQALAASSRTIDPHKSPCFFLAIERRDPQLIDHALACAPVPLTRVPTKKLRKALVRAGIHWDTSDWQGVEIWKGSL